MITAEATLHSLIESEGMELRYFLEQGNECIVVLNRRQHYVYANRAAHEYVGKRDGTLVGKSLREGLGNLPHMFALWEARINTVFQTGETYEFEDRTPLPDHTMYSKSTAYPIRSTDGSIYAVGIVYHDISVAAQRLNALSRDVLRKQEMLPEEHDLVCRFSAGGRIRFANQTFRAFFRIPEHAVCSLSIAALIPEINLSMLLAHMKQNGGRSSVIETEYTLFSAEGEARYLRCTFCHNRKPGNGSEEILMVGHDISMLRRFELARREENMFAYIGRMSALITHELRTPLTSLQMNVDMLRRNRMTAKAHSQSLDILHRELTRLRSIVDDILDFSRLKDLHCSCFPIEDLVTEVCEMLEGSLQLRSVTLGVDVAPCTLYADHDKIRDVLLILLGNAFEALKGEGWISLHGTIRSNADQYVLTVMDSGPGIREPEKIFLPFYSTKEHGTGMGLPRGLKIAESHGGSLVLVSPQAGETTFAFTIPIWRSRHGAHPGNR